MLALKSKWLYGITTWNLYPRSDLVKLAKTPFIKSSMTVAKIPGIMLRVCCSSKTVLVFSVLIVLWVVYNTFFSALYNFTPSTFLLVTVILSSIDVLLSLFNLVSLFPHRFSGDTTVPSGVQLPLSDIGLSLPVPANPVIQ